MQIGTQPHTHRVWKYFQERHQWHDVFPEDFADSAEEVGPFTDQGGPCLVLFRNMHLTPKQLDKWLDKCFVGRVCMRVFWLDNSIPAAANRCVDTRHNIKRDDVRRGWFSRGGVPNNKLPNNRMQLAGHHAARLTLPLKGSSGDGREVLMCKDENASTRCCLLLPYPDTNASLPPYLGRQSHVTGSLIRYLVQLLSSL